MTIHSSDGSTTRDPRDPKLAAGLETLHILGAGGHGKVVAEVAHSMGFQKVVFFDKKWPALRSLFAWEIIGDESSFFGTGDSGTAKFVAIGDNRTRCTLVRRLLAQGAQLPVLVHRDTSVSSLAEIGPGSVVMPRAAIGPSATIGGGCIINTSAVVEHDCHVGFCSHLSPGAILGGGARVGDCVWIGLGASVKPNVVIAGHSVVGLGSAVISDVPAATTVVGVPARPLGSKSYE